MKNKKETKATKGMAQFFTRKRAEDGHRLNLKYPNGDPSPDWLVIRGVDSDIFRDADNQMRRDILAAAVVKDPEQKEANFKKAQLKLVATLVKSWSFPEPCTPENVMELFREAPQIMDLVDQEASKKSNFFGPSSLISLPMPSTSSDSISDQTPHPAPPSDSP